ncbi:acyl-CoA desaturase [Actinomadura algeriensis]|uniref:Stearoyl-CoA desaturase (Delta-9 desaturase) n=1 Tax=Actinomadura algeriensis TaxID=1679523 RepID=A0ABR9JV48_9ACTN|nr:acyl-CoA desaturase [Actinomadura algeriensis]MBE1534284.1 stearoyl-CoA desaturase (delta-9 desaturase) [Actinomadura algeriensis]
MATMTAPPEAAIVKLDRSSARIKWITAFSMMTLPGLGTAAAAVLLWQGIFTATDLWLFAGMYLVHMFGITIGFHRYLAHKSFKTSRFFEGVLMIAGSMGGQGPIMYWVTTHRRHHRFSDRDGDPHSPNLAGAGLAAKLRGLWWAHMPWMLSDESSSWRFWAPDVLRDRRLFFYHRTYQLWMVAGLLLPAAIGFAVEGTATAALTGFVFGGLARMFLANQAAWCVGSLSHMFGGRPFDNGDRSANNWPVAVFTFGEGLQNNHHAFPGSYRHAVRAWEPDLSGWALTVLGRLRVVRDLRQPDAAAIAARRARGPRGDRAAA